MQKDCKLETFPAQIFPSFHFSTTSPTRVFIVFLLCSTFRVKNEKSTIRFRLAKDRRLCTVILMGYSSCHVTLVRPNKKQTNKKQPSSILPSHSFKQYLLIIQFFRNVDKLIRQCWKCTIKVKLSSRYQVTKWSSRLMKWNAQIPVSSIVSIVGNKCSSTVHW